MTEPDPDTPAGGPTPPGPPAGADTIELVCEECGATVSGPPRGRNSAAWALGRHRYAKHRTRGTSEKANRRRANAPDDADYAARPTLSIIRDAAAEVGARKGVPTATDLTKGLGRGLGLTSVAVASWLVESDPAITDDKMTDAMIDYLSLDERAAGDIMRPIGNAVAPTRLNRKYGRAVVDNVDVIASVAELGTLAMHWRRYLRLRAGQPAGAGQPDGPPVPAPAGPPPAGVQPTTPGPRAGVVMTSDDVQRLQRKDG